MSLLPTSSWITPNNPLFLLANISTLTATNITTSNLTAINTQTTNLSTAVMVISSIVGTEGGVNIDFGFISSLNSDGRIEAYEFSSIFTYAQEGTVSTLFTQHIVLDAATLDVVNGNVLLLNGIPLATTSTSVSSLQDWAFYPALQAVDMNTFALSNVGNINCQNIFNALNVQSDTFTTLTSITSPAGTINQLRTTGLSTNTFQVNTVQNGGNTNWLSPLSVSTLGVSTLNLNSLTVPVVRASGLSSLTVSTGTINGVPYTAGSNWSQYPATSAVQLAGNNVNTSGNLTFNVSSNTFLNGSGDISFTADGGINIASITDIAFTAQNGNRGQITLLADSGFNNGVGGTVNITANGGQVAGVGTGGTVNITANTPIGFSNLTSKISLSASGINSYAGSIPPLASIYGYNFIYGQLGVNICGGLPPALPNVPGTTYLYGTTGVTTSSDFYVPRILPYFNGVQTPPDLLISGRFIVPNAAQVYLVLSNVKDMWMDGGASIRDCKNIYMSNTSANQISNLANLIMSNGVISNANTITGSGTISGYTTVSATNVGFTTATGTTVNAGALNGNTVVASNSLTTPLVSTISLNLSNMNAGAVRVGSKSLAVVGDIAQIQASNTAGQRGVLNLLMKQNNAEIQSFNSSFTVPLDMRFTANTFGFNIGSANIEGGYFFDVSGNAIFENGFVKVGTDTAEGTKIYNDHLNISTIRQPVIQYGNIATNGNAGNVLTRLSTPYVDTNYVVQLTHSDTGAGANTAYNKLSRSSFQVYWTNASGGNHTTAYTTFGNLS